MSNVIKYGKKVKIIFDMTKKNACYLLEYELPLRWGLPYYHWMYPAFVYETPIPFLLIYPQ